MDAITKACGALALIGLWGCAGAETRPPPTPDIALGSRAEMVLEPVQYPAARPFTARRLELTGWSRPGRQGAGLSLGVWASDRAPLPVGATDRFGLWVPQIGAHWRMPLASRLQLQVSGWMPLQEYGAAHNRWPLRNPDVAYAARLEVQWSSPRWGGLIPEYGAIGVQLQGSSSGRLLLRARHGGPMIYYRAKF